MLHSKYYIHYDRLVCTLLVSYGVLGLNRLYPTQFYRVHLLLIVAMCEL